ncbi:MAG TPA: DUF167 domain-containing protein [Candidatus Dormibacteraeota bacterium]|nr:DUF167 domain-containing protein [Candidatus Dormibacteraeota bacterium]
MPRAKFEDLKANMAELQIRENLNNGTVIFSVRVHPRCSKDEISGEMAGAVRVRLRAPALENRANEALIELLAQLLKTPKSAVRILSGDRSRVKRIQIRGVTKQQVLGLLMHDA